MNWGWLAFVAPIGLGFAAWWFSRRVYFWDYQLGLRAYRDGLALNAKWSKGTRDGWSDAWHYDRAERVKRAGPPWPTK